MSALGVSACKSEDSSELTKPIWSLNSFRLVIYRRQVLSDHQSPKVSGDFNSDPEGQETWLKPYVVVGPTAPIMRAVHS